MSSAAHEPVTTIGDHLESIRESLEQLDRDIDRLDERFQALLHAEAKRLDLRSSLDA